MPNAKAATTKYFIASLEERNGEYRYTHDFLIKTEGRAKPEAALKRHARAFYDCEREPDGDGFYFNGGEVYVEPGQYKQISEASFNELKDFLTFLS